MISHILGTDVLTLLQNGHPSVHQRAGSSPAGSIAITVLSVEEQLSGWYAELRKAKRPDRLALVYHRLAEQVRFLARLPILDFDVPAIRRYEALRDMKLRVGRTDLQIAAVALEHQATVVTVNVRDFKRVPGLRIEDWSK